MKTFTIYDPETGVIKRSGYCPDRDVGLQAQDGEEMIEGSSDFRTQYVVSGEVVSRPPMPFYIDRDGVAIGGVATVTMLPVGTVVKVDGQDEVVVDDGVLEFTFDTAGEYQVEMKKFPYLDKTLVITCD